MPALGIVTLWFGYSIFYYGLNTVLGGNDKFLSLIWPGAYTPMPRDGQAGSSSSAGTQPAAQTPITRAEKCPPLSPSTWVNPKCGILGLVTGAF